RLAVAQNDAISVSIMNKLMDDESVSVQRSLIRNGNVPDSLVKQLLMKHDAAPLVRSALSRQSISIEFLQPLILKNINSEQLCIDAADREDLTTELIDALYKQAMDKRSSWGEAQDILDQLALNMRTSSAMMLDIISDARFYE